MMFILLLVFLGGARANPCDWWYEETTHGWSYRNVTAFGCKADGVSDDTKCIQDTIDFQRGGEAGSNADKSAAMVYIPAGTYVISSTLVLWKWTKLLGNPLCLPTLLVKSGTPAFGGGAKGWLPVLITTDGSNSSTSQHAWWDEEGVNEVNEIFFTQVHNLNIRVEPKNPGAVPLTWNVAQQTSLRNVHIQAAPDTPVALDVGAGPEYAHWNEGVSYSLGGGGVVEDVSVTGGIIGMRMAAAQFEMRNLAISGSGQVGVQVSQLAWSLVVLNSTISAPLPLQIQGALPGTFTLLDSTLHTTASPTISPLTFITTDASSLLLQNVLATSGSGRGSSSSSSSSSRAGAPGGQCFIVDASLACPETGGGLTPLWAQGPVYTSGNATGGGGGGTGGAVVPLPTLADAAAQGVALKCATTTSTPLGAPHLCGGSTTHPETGIPHRPPPNITNLTPPPVNAYEAGCAGDGVTDVTACLQALLTANPNVFLPFGIYLVSNTLTLRPDALVFGEGLSVIRLAPSSPGFQAGASKPLLLVPPTSTPTSVRLWDLALWNMDCGNEGVILLVWGGGSGEENSIHDFNMLVAATAEAKALILPQAQAYFGNTWWPATTAYDPTFLHRRAAAAYPFQTTSLLPPPPLNLTSSATCSFTSEGVILGSQGPFFWVGVNLEHSVVVEVAMAPGTTNTIFAGFQTEEAEVAMVLNETSNALVYGALTAFWNASVASPAQMFGVRKGTGGGGGGVDLAYRVYAYSVPISVSEQAHFVDEIASGGGYVIPTVDLFSQTTAILNVDA